jgi:hypothetical protein
MKTIWAHGLICAVFAAVATPYMVAQSASSSDGQRPQPKPSSQHCPVIKVTCPEGVEINQPVVAIVDVSGGDRRVTPTFNWTTSAGTISSGQGTSAVVIDTTGASGQTATAAVRVGGFAESCEPSASCSTNIAAAGPPPIEIGEYTTTDLSADAEMLDLWILELQRDPTVVGVVIAYGGRRSRPGDAQKAADNATDYAQDVRGVALERLLSGVGGYREQPTVELWISFRDGAQPQATPTVNPKDVKPPPR